MQDRTTVEQVLAEHRPRSGDDPLYIPWWAKGEYAARVGTKWAMPDGTKIEGGQVVRRGSGAFPSASKAEELYQPRPLAASARETRERGKTTPSRAKRAPDRVDELLQEHRTLDARTVLCIQHGIDPAILRDAPNPGVASMRLANALRKALQ